MGVWIYLISELSWSELSLLIILDILAAYCIIVLSFTVTAGIYVYACCVLEP